VEYKSIQFELKGVDKGKRTADIAFATYNNIDRGKDILRPGAFKKSWTERKSDIRFFLNHDPSQAPGKALEFYDDNNQAVAKAFLGTHTLGEDTLKMMDEGIITDASFGYRVEKKNFIDVKGEQIRELLEVNQREFSVLTDWGMNELSKVRSVQKNLAGIDLEELKARINKIEKFCRNTTASDETIKSLLQDVKVLQSLVAGFDTATTHDDEPDASDPNEVLEGEQNTVLSRIKLLHTQMALGQ
jgi:HK97 family phage prohead protease